MVLDGLAVEAGALRHEVVTARVIQVRVDEPAETERELVLAPGRIDRLRQRRNLVRPTIVVAAAGGEERTCDDEQRDDQGRADRRANAQRFSTSAAISEAAPFASLNSIDVLSR